MVQRQGWVNALAEQAQLEDLEIARAKLEGLENAAVESVSWAVD